MIHEEICTYEVARSAKEKGFPQDPKENDNCQIYCWDNLRKIHSLCISAMWYTGEFNCEDMYAAPTQSLLQRWLREEKGMHIIIDGGFQWGLEDLQRHFMDRDIQVEIGAFGLFDTYEEALHDALLYSLQNV
jgi:hypothetical protein